MRCAFRTGHGGRPRRYGRPAGSACSIRPLAVCLTMRGGNRRPEGPILRAGSTARSPLGRAVIHTACPNKGGSIRPGGAGSPCLRGNRAAPCPMRMDCRLFTALAVSGRLLRSGYMAAVRRDLIHIGGGTLHSLFGSICSALSRSRTGVRLCSCLLTGAGKSRRGASAAGTATRRRRRGCARIGTRLRRASAGTAALPAFISNGISGGFCDGASDPLDNRISHHAWKPAAEPIAGEGGVKPHAGDDAVYLAGNPGDTYDQKHPGQDGNPAWYIPQSRNQQLQEYDIHNHHHAHRAEHPAPALENVLRIFGPAHAKGKRGHENENSRYDIPFRHLEAQLDKLPHHDNANNDDQEPGSSNRKIIFIRDGDGDAGGNLKQRNHLR